MILLHKLAALVVLFGRLALVQKKDFVIGFLRKLQDIQIFVRKLRKGWKVSHASFAVAFEGEFFEEKCLSIGFRLHVKVHSGKLNGEFFFKFLATYVPDRDNFILYAKFGKAWDLKCGRH